MAGPSPYRLVFGIPIPLVVIGLPVLAVVAVALLSHPAAVLPASPVATADLLFQDRADGGVDVLRAGDRGVVEVMPPKTGAFVRVLLAGLVRERRRESEGSPSVPFHLTRWSDGRLTLDDLATHQLIELNAFGPDNSGAFAELLRLSQPGP